MHVNINTIGEKIKIFTFPLPFSKFNQIQINVNLMTPN